MMVFFWDEHGILISHFVKARQTTNAAYYCHVLKTELYPALHKKHPHLRPELMILEHDNAQPHSALITQATITELAWELLEHPACSPDFATCDFFFFGWLKVFMQGRTFLNRGGMGAHVHQYIGSLELHSLKKAIKSLPACWIECIALFRAYSEKEGSCACF